MSLGYDGQIRIDSSIDSKGFNKGISAMTSSLKGLAAAVGIAFGIGAVVAFGKAAVDAASEIQSAYIGLRSIVEGTGNSFAKANEFIKSYVSDGLVPASNAVTAYKNLLMRGYNTDQIESTMIALKNSAAFGRQASLTMGQAVQSATEGLKNENSILVDNAGVTKNVSTMWMDYAESIGVGVNSLTKAQKIQAETIGIMEETRFQMNDAAKLSDTYSGKVSALGVSFQNLKVAIGNSIIPIINQILPYIKSAVDWLVIFFNKVASIMNLLFGTNVSMADTATATAESMDAVTANTDAATGAQNDLADATTKAGKAAKGALGAFDDLNVLQQAPEAGTGIVAGGGVTAAGATPAAGAGLPIPDPAALDAGLTGYENQITAFKNKMILLIQPVIDAFDRLKIALTPLGETIWAGLKWAWDNILVPLGAWTISDLLPAFLDLLGAAGELLNSVLTVLQPTWQLFWDNFLKPVAEWTGGIIVEVLGYIADGLLVVSAWIDEHSEGISMFITVVASLAAGLWLLNIAVGAINTIIGIYNSIMAIAALVTGAITLPILAVMALVIALGVLIYLLIANWDTLKVTVGQIWGIIVILVQQASLAIQKAFWDALNSVRGKFIEVFNNVKSFLTGVFTSITQFISASINTLISNIANFSSGMVNSFTKSLDTIKGKFEGIFRDIQNVISGVANTIMDIISSMVSGALEGINAVIDAANSIGDATGIGGNIPSFDMPRLATGAVIPPNSQFAAILGDQKSGRNLEAPEGLIRQIVREESGGGRGGEITIKFEGTLAGLVRELKPYIDKENVRIGGNLITGGIV